MADKTPSETLMQVMEDFSSCEPKAVVVIYTNENDEMVVTAHIPRTLALGLVEAAKDMILRNGK